MSILVRLMLTRTSNYIALLLALLLLFYTGYRAATLSFTIDESQSYHQFVPLSFMEIVSYNTEFSANNHILNTLCMKLSSWLFGPSELALRLHNVIAHGIYLLCSFLILQRYTKGVALVCGFIL